MKTIFFGLGMLVLSISAPAQTFDWVRFGTTSNTDANYESAIASVVLANNQVVSAGYFFQNLTLDNRSLTALPSGNFIGRNGFVEQRTTTGNATWLTSGQGNNTDATALAADPSGNVLVAYRFGGDAVFEGQTISALSWGTFASELVSYTPTGQLRWLKKLDTGVRVEVQSACATANGGFVVGGLFAGTLALPGQPAITAATWLAPNTYAPFSGFLAQFDAAGNCQWLRRTGDRVSKVSGVAVDGAGNVCVHGAVISTSSITFAPNIVVLPITTPNPGGWQTSDGFVAKYSAQGDVQWVRLYGGPEYEFSEGIATDASGAVFVCGQFGSKSVSRGTATADFGPFQLTTTAGGAPPSGLGKSDGFVAKYDAQGTCQWVQAMRSGDAENPRALAVTQGGDVYVGGSAYGGVLFGANTVLPALTFGYQGFVAKYAGSTGNLRWLRGFGGTGSFFGASNFYGCMGLATDGVGKIYVGGGFMGNTDFGTVVAVGPRSDITYPFIAALNDDELRNPLAARPAVSRNAPDFQVYPNPGSGAVQTSWPAGLRATQLDVLDLLGRAVRRVALGSGQAQATLQLEQLPRGLYVLRLSGGPGPVLTRKLTLE